jgi:glycosyltransferase involved in cell wall biosynthesis
VTSVDRVATTEVSSKRVLLVTKIDFADPRDGGALRVSAIHESLREAGFGVDSVVVRSAVARDRHRDGKRAHRWAAVARVALVVARVGSVSVARWFSPSAAGEIAALVRTNTYDAVLVEYSQLLVYRDLFGTRPVVLDMHNVEHELLGNYAASSRSLWRRLLAGYERFRVRTLEDRSRRLVDAVITVSGHDADYVRRTPGEAVVKTASNGVSDAAFDVVRRESADPTVVFIGNLGWQPNVDAARWLVQEVWPIVRGARRDAKRQLIGRQPARSLTRHNGRNGVSIHPDVPSTLEYLGAATVATAPLLAAGGTRLKILEAMASGTPVVSTSLGALGLEHLASRGAMVIADDPSRFADALVGFLSSVSDPESIRRQVDGYRWEQVLRSLVDVVDEQARSVDVRPYAEMAVSAPKDGGINLR